MNTQVNQVEKLRIKL
jgi:hypothetical protein